MEKQIFAVTFEIQTINVNQYYRAYRGVCDEIQQFNLLSLTTQRQISATRYTIYAVSFNKMNVFSYHCK